MKKTVSENAAIWDRALKEIRSSLTDPNVYDSFFQGTYVDSWEDGRVVIVANSKLGAQILESTYLPLIRSALGLGNDAQIVFSTIDGVGENNEKSPQKPTFFSDYYLNQNYTFDNFFTGIGDANHEAYQAALAIANNPGTLYNPLLIYGDSGLGKTHLLHAIGNRIRARDPSARVLCVTTQDFFDEYVKFVRGGQGGESLKSFFHHSVDVLLIDDIQFLVGKTGTEEMFFSVFQTLYQNGKQVVITSDQHPSRLNGLDERLKTRFVQGLAQPVGRPTKEIREKILKRKVMVAGFDISDFDPEIFPYYADKFNGSVRELEGAINKLIFYCNLTKKTKVDLKTAIEAVQAIIDSSGDGNKLSADKIVDAVSGHYGLTKDVLLGKSRIAQVALARHISMYLCREILSMPYKKIGEFFGGRDHATVMNGVQNVEKVLVSDPDSAATIRSLRQEIEDVLKKESI